MLLGLVFVVLIISVAMLFAIFSSFIPFSNSYGNIAQYSAAYYSAISAIERGALAVKYAGPGFDGQSGWRFSNNASGHTFIGNNGDNWSGDFFSYGNSGATTMYWEVQSSTTRIPKEKEGDVEPILIGSGSNSENYNMLSYNKTELIPLNGAYTVSDPTKYYKGGQGTISTKISILSGEFRLNPYLFEKIIESSCSSAKDCSILCETTNCPGEKDVNRNKNMPMIDWVIKGIYSGAEFSVIPTESSNVANTSYSINLAKDSVIRKHNINQEVGSKTTPIKTVRFGAGRQVNIYNSTLSPKDKTVDEIKELNVISTKATALKSMSSFSNLLGTGISDPYLSLELINYLWNNKTLGHQLYPFLEYEFDLGSKGSDRYYTIKGEGMVGKYNIKLQVKKPTMKDSSLGNFTIIF